MIASKRLKKLCIPNGIMVFIAFLFWIFDFDQKLYLYPLYFSLVIGLYNWKKFKNNKWLFFFLWNLTSFVIFVASVRLDRLFYDFFKSIRTIEVPLDMLQGHIGFISSFSYYIFNPLFVLISIVFIFKTKKNLFTLFCLWIATFILLFISMFLFFEKHSWNNDFFESYPLAFLVWQIVVGFAIQYYLYPKETYIKHDL